jgi:DNA-binding transcriptional LysR family regulator
VTIFIMTAGGGGACVVDMGFSFSLFRASALEARWRCYSILYARLRPAAPWKVAHPPCNDAHVAQWDDLRFFLAVHRAGTLVAAGKALKVDHTTVSRRLRAFESALHARLFDRRPDRLELTQAGARILETARSMEEQFLSLEARVSQEDRRLEGSVRIATSHTVAARFLVPQLGFVRERHPGIEIEIVTGPGAYDLPRREADIALRFSKPEQRTLIVRKLADVAFAAYASRGYIDARGRPNRLGDLSGHDVVGYDREGAFIPGAKWLAEHADGARSVLRCDQILSIAAGAVAGLGIAVLPCIAADCEPTLVRVWEQTLVQDSLHLVVHEDVLRVTRVRAVVDAIAALTTLHADVLRGVPPSRGKKAKHP